jgi:hypothetical protein
MHILLCGDSFATDYTKYQSTEYPGWPNLLAKKFTVTNLAQAGVSEYKILKQVQSMGNDYDVAVVSHTSPFRVHARKHPFHTQGLHQDCDLLYADIMEKSSWWNPALQACKSYFTHIYDFDYQMDVYQLLFDKIKHSIHVPCIHICHNNLGKEIQNVNLDFTDTWYLNQGKVNHYNQQGNKLVYQTLCEALQ